MFSLFIYKWRKPIFVFALVLFSLLGIFGVVKPTYAFWGWVIGAAAGAAAIFGVGEAANVVGEIIEKAGAVFLFLFSSLLRGLIDLCGDLFLKVTEQLVQVAQYNNFLYSQAVQTGWVVVRDVGNMFFVVVLLVIAIATILHVESYSYKKLLPRLLLMAVLINFSKTICGIFIDFAQVIMLTFVNAWKAAAGANFVQAFGIDKVYDLAKEEAGNTSAMIGALVLGLFVVLIALATVSVLLVMLIARIVVLWILIILSPLAFLMASFPQGKVVSDKWRDYFTKYAITGPMLAFFIWLALIVAGGGTGNEQVGVIGGTASGVAGSALGTVEKLSSIIVATSMFLIGLMVAQQMGVAGSGLAGAVLNRAKQAGTAPLRWAKAGAQWGWGKTKQAAGRGAGNISDYTYAKTGVALPFSARRREAAEKRRKNISAMREAEGMARTAERMAGGRAFLASVIDPRAASKMSRWEMAKATVGWGETGKEARAKVQRAADGLASSAADDTRAVDKLEGERLQQRTEKEMAERRLKKVEGSKGFKTMKAGRVGDLTTAVTSSQAEATTQEQEANRLLMINKFQKRVNLSDDDLRKVIIEDKAENDLRQEKDRRKRSGLSELSEGEENRFFQDRKSFHDPSTTLAEAQAEKVNMQAALAGVAPVSDEQVKAAQAELGKAKEKFDAATHSLETYRDRDNNPKAARADALARREAARERGDDIEAKKINLELDELDAKIKISDVNNFFKMTYNEQINVAKKSAEGLSESKLAKDIAAALKAGDISTPERNEVMKLWAEKDFKAAKDRFSDILKKNTEAKKAT